MILASSFVIRRPTFVSENLWSIPVWFIHLKSATPLTSHHPHRNRDERRRDERKRRDFDRHGKSGSDSHRERERHERRRGSPRGRSYSRSRSRSRSGSRGKSRDREHRGGRGEKVPPPTTNNNNSTGEQRLRREEAPESLVSTAKRCISDGDVLLETCCCEAL